MQKLSILSATRKSNLFAVATFALTACIAAAKSLAATYSSAEAAPAGTGTAAMAAAAESAVPVAAHLFPLLAAALSAAALAAAGALTLRATARTGVLGAFCTLPLPLFGFAAFGLCFAPSMLLPAISSLGVAAGMAAYFHVIRNHGEKDLLLHGSVSFALAALIYPPCILLGLLIPAAAIIFPLTWRQIVTALAGWLLPLLAAGYACWLTGGHFADALLRLTDPDSSAMLRYTASASVSMLPLTAVLPAGVLMLTILAGALRFALIRQSMLVRMRSSMAIAYVALALTLGGALLPGAGVGWLATAAVPAAVTASFGLEKCPPRTSEHLYRILLLGLAVHLFLT